MTPDLYRRQATPSLYDPFRFFDDLFTPLGSLRADSTLRTDITDLGDSFLLEADLPGFRREDIHLELNGSTLTLRAERRMPEGKEGEERRLVRAERVFGTYRRDYDLSGIAHDRIRSKYEDGVLRVTLPKKEPTAPKTVELSIE